TIDAVLLAEAGVNRDGADAAPALAELDLALAELTRAQPALLGELMSRSPGEPFRTFLLHTAQRLQATRLVLTGEDERRHGLAYESAGEFIAELRLLQRALAEAGADRQAFGELQHLIWQAETFGFHLAELEVRQHSAVHAAALRELRAGQEPSA